MALLILTSDGGSHLLINNLSVLKGIAATRQLEKDLKFCRAVLDGELEPKVTMNIRGRLSDQDQTWHSLYLHCRQLLNLVKMADADASCRTESLLQQISCELKDCTICLDLASRKHHPISSR